MLTSNKPPAAITKAFDEKVKVHWSYLDSFLKRDG